MKTLLEYEQNTTQNFYGPLKMVFLPAPTNFFRSSDDHIFWYPLAKFEENKLAEEWYARAVIWKP